MLAMSDDAFTYLLLLIVTGAYALIALIWVGVVIVQAVRGSPEGEA